MSEQNTNTLWFVTEQDWAAYRHRQTVRELLIGLLWFVIGVGAGVAFVGLVWL